MAVKKFLIVNDYDANEVHKLDAIELQAALFEALEKLGWNLVIADEADDDYPDEDAELI